MTTIPGQRMHALVMQAPWRLAVEQLPEPRPGEGEALLDVIATGICGSDLHGYTGETGRRQPGQVMGHETVARVLDDPSGTYPPGRIVTVNPVVGCGGCEQCRAGRTQRCPQRRIIGVTPGLVSALAQRMSAPVGNLVALPAGIDPEIGALVEPLAVGYHAARQGQVGPGDMVLVLGGGPIGQAAALAADRLGASRVLVCEPVAARRDKLSSLRLDTMDPSAGADEVVRRLGRPATVVLDAVGTSRTLATAVDCTELGARIVLAGMNEPRVELPAYAISTGERSLVGSFCYDVAEFIETAAWAATAADRVARLVDHRVGLDDAPQAFRDLAAGTLAASKVVVYLHGVPEVSAREGARR